MHAYQTLISMLHNLPTDSKNKSEVVEKNEVNNNESNQRKQPQHSRIGHNESMDLTSHFRLTEKKVCDTELSISESIYKDISKCLELSDLNKVKTDQTTKQNLVSRLNIQYNRTYLAIEKQMYTFNKEKLLVLQESCNFLKRSVGTKALCLVCNVHIPDTIQSIYEHSFLVQHLEKFQHLRKKDFNQYILLREFLQANGAQKKKQLNCLSCCCSVGHCKNKIMTHISSKQHMSTCQQLRAQNKETFNAIIAELESSWYSIQRFCCALCKTVFYHKIEFLQHIIQKHKKIIEKLTQKSDILFDVCITCTTLWLGFSDTYSVHCMDIMHRYLAKTKLFAIDSLPECVTDILIHVDETTHNLFRLSQETLRNKGPQDELKECLQESLISWFPNLQVHFFGSRVTGLCSSDSDIDVYLENASCAMIEDQCGKSDVHESTKSLLFIKETLMGTGEWIVKQVLENSRTPIIKVKHKPTNLDCDISLSSGLAVQNSKLLRSYNAVCPQCQKMTLFLKKWLSFCNFNGKNGITNYALAWYVIFYLQVNESMKLPSVAALIKKENKSKLINGWETGIAYPTWSSTTDIPVPQLLLGFFKYYAEFDYSSYVVCPLMGQVLQKEKFAIPNTLPKEMKLYIKQLKTSTPEYFRMDSPMCIQDPFDLSHNLTKAVKAITLKRFKQYCQDSATVLSSVVQ